MIYYIDLKDCEELPVGLVRILYANCERVWPCSDISRYIFPNAEIAGEMAKVVEDYGVNVENAVGV
jgi:hypothetical protein